MIIGYREGAKQVCALEDLILAIDPEHIPLRLVRASLHEGNYARPEGHQSFYELEELEDYLDGWSLYSPLRIVAPGGTGDPLGAIPWLEKEGHTVQKFPLAPELYSQADQLSSHRVPDTHRFAYVVAVIAACRDDIQGATRDIACGLHYLKSDLSRILLQANIVTATLTEEDHADPGDFNFCPF